MRSICGYLQALEVIYSKAKAMERTKTLFYAGFRHALNYLSEDKNVTFAATVEQLIALNPPERKQLIGLVSSGVSEVHLVTPSLLSF